MLFGETVAVYCENHMEHTNTLSNNIQEFSPYLTGNKLRLHYKAQMVISVRGNSRCLLWEPYGIQKYTMRAESTVYVKFKQVSAVNRVIN
jgi:hypothetical protein